MMSTDLKALWSDIQRGDTHAIASHLFPPSADTAHKSYVIPQGQKDVTQAGLGSVEAGSSREVTCRARYYEAAGRILEDELGLHTHENANDLGGIIEQWLARKRDNWEPRT